MNKEEIIRFLYVCYNYHNTDIEAGLEATHCPIHLREKLKRFQSRNNGTHGLINFLMELSDNNKELFIGGMMDSYANMQAK